MDWSPSKLKRGKTRLNSPPAIGGGVESLECRTVLSSGVGALQSPLAGVAAMFMIDVSDSMNGFRNLDVNRDGLLNGLDDVNGDEVKGSSLDESINAIVGYIEQGQLPPLLSLVVFGADAKPLDMSPEPGLQAVGPTYADFNNNGVYDSIEMLRTLRIGGGGLYSDTRVDPTRTFYDRPLEAFLEIAAEYPNVTFRANLANDFGDLPVTNPDPGQGLLIDNDLDPSTVGYFSMLVGDGGSSNYAGVTAQGRTQTFVNEDFLFAFVNGISVAGGGAVPLQDTTISQPAARVPSGEDVVTSAGSFTGQNGQVEWTATTSIADGSTVVVNTVTFTSANPLGALQFGNYLDEDVGASFFNNILYPSGAPGQANFAAFTLENVQRVGFSQGGVYTPDGTRLVNATYDGWAADEFPDLINELAAGTATFSVAGDIDLVDLPPFIDPALGLVYGPANVTTAFAWTVDPNAFTATVTTFLNLIPVDPTISFAGGVMTDGSGLLSSNDDVLNALAAANLPVSVFLAGHYFEVGSLRSVERIAESTNGQIVVPRTPVIVDNASIPPVVPPDIQNSLLYQIQVFGGEVAVEAAPIPEALVQWSGLQPTTAAPSPTQPPAVENSTAEPPFDEGAESFDANTPSAQEGVDEAVDFVLLGPIL